MNVRAFLLLNSASTCDARIYPCTRGMHAKAPVRFCTVHCRTYRRSTDRIRTTSAARWREHRTRHPPGPLAVSAAEVHGDPGVASARIQPEFLNPAPVPLTGLEKTAPLLF